MSEEHVGREEFDYKIKEIKDDVNSLGDAMRESVKDNKQTASFNLKEFKTVDFKEHKDNVREDFKAVWKAIDGMLVKVGALVTVCCTVVMLLFKFAEAAQ